MIASEFKRRCEAMGVTPPPDVCSKLQPNEGNGSSGPPEEINLSGTSINPKVISSLMTALETDSTISTLILADAFLGDDGAIAIGNCLKINKSIQTLDLRGNNIRCDGTLSLAQMLKVNNTLRTLLLEWNCVGIWEVGVRALADALAANRRLETLDLRNCKVGPRGCQTLAVGIKHNTSLRHLDLRWNNAGLIGGRAFVDVLQWNMSILEVLLTGNEVPEEVMRSVTVLLQRNKDKQAVSALTASHSEQLSSTLQTLAKHHQDAVEKLQHKLHSSDSKHQSVAERLAVASRDLSAAQAASKAAEDRANAIERDFSVFKAEGNARISDLQKDLKSEREKRLALEEKVAKLTSSSSCHAAELEASLREKEMKVEVLKRDKVLLLEELDKQKQREKDLQDLFHEKQVRAESSFQAKLLALEERKDEELRERLKKAEERHRIVEAARAKVVEELDEAKARALLERRSLMDRISETELKVRKEEEIKRKELESQLDSMRVTRDQLQVDLNSHATSHAACVREYEAESKRFNSHRIQLNEEIVELKSQLARATADSALLQQRLEQSQKTERESVNRESRMQSDLARANEETEKAAQASRLQLEKVAADSEQKDITISKLRESIRRLEQELADEREDQNLRMKELSMQISAVLSRRERASRRTVPEQ